VQSLPIFPARPRTVWVRSLAKNLGPEPRPTGEPCNIGLVPVQKTQSDPRFYLFYSFTEGGALKGHGEGGGPHGRGAWQGGGTEEGHGHGEVGGPGKGLRHGVGKGGGTDRGHVDGGAQARKSMAMVRGAVRTGHGECWAAPRQGAAHARGAVIKLGGKWRGGRH